MPHQRTNSTRRGPTDAITEDTERPQASPNILERLFALEATGTDARTEILAGVTTFLTMAYIIFVNPPILGDAGMPKGAVFVATCLFAAVGTLHVNTAG